MKTRRCVIYCVNKTRLIGLESRVRNAKNLVAEDIVLSCFRWKLVDKVYPSDDLLVNALGITAEIQGVVLNRPIACNSEKRSKQRGE